MQAHLPTQTCRANAFAERLRLGLAVIHGEEKDVDRDADGRNSPPPQDSVGDEAGGASAAPIVMTPSKSGKYCLICVV